MINYTETLYKLYPSVVKTIDGIAYDSQGNTVTYDEATIQAYIDANEYKSLRQAEYPPLTDLADALYHQSKGD